MLFNSSDINFVLLSLDFICFSWRFFRTLAANVFNGTDKILNLSVSNIQVSEGLPDKP